MFITQSNAIKGLSPNITTGLGTDLPSNVTSSDFSLNYTSTNATLTMEFGAISNVSYVAVSSLNLSRMAVYDGSTLIKRADLSLGGVGVLVFDLRNFSNLKILAASNTNKPTVAHVAAGVALQIPNGGETSGYNRNYLTRAKETRVISSDLGAPVSSLQKSVPLSGSLNLPNMTKEFTLTSWQSVLSFLATGEVFYITEQSDLLNDEADASYACFNPKFSAPTAHSQTRSLNDVKLGFSCYNGI